MKKINFKFRLLPVIAFSAVVLLLLRAYSYNMDIGPFTDIPIDGKTRLGDVFCYVKSEACFIITVWAFLNLLFLVITGQLKIRKSPIYIPMAIYTVAVVISFVLSEYKVIAWYGGINRFEGTRTILCYMFMLFYIINVVESSKDALVVIVPTLVSVFIACLIGITQLVGRDVLVSQLSSMAIGNGYELQAEFWPGQVYQTVYNMNYVGMYLALFIPMLLFAFVKGVKEYRSYSNLNCKYSKNHILAIVILSGILLVVVALNLYGADSVGGVLGIGAAIVLLIVMLCDKKSVRIVIILTSLVAFVAILSYIYFIGKDTIKCIDYFVTGRDEILTSIDGNELTIRFNKDTKEYSLFDVDGKSISVKNYKNKEGNFQLDDDRFKGKFVLIPLEVEGKSILYFDAFNEEFYFLMDGEEVLYINPYLKEISLDKIDSIGFKGHLSAGSGRGYIWSRTLPLVKKHLFIGSGADTFLFEFPQNDYAGKYSAEYFLDTLIDKPHNMYLQMIVCTGGISCLAFLIMMFMFLKEAIKTGRDNYIILTLSAGVFGFLIVGIFNDSSVCTMPVFYSMLGVIIGIQHHTEICKE